MVPAAYVECQGIGRAAARAGGAVRRRHNAGGGIEVHLIEERDPHVPSGGGRSAQKGFESRLLIFSPYVRPDWRRSPVTSSTTYWP